MRPTTPRKPLVLAIHPNFSGFGWIAVEGPLSVHDWGVPRIRIDKNSNSLKRIEMLIDRLRPETLVLESFDPHTSVRRERITKLCRATVALAQDRGVEVAVFSRDEVRTTFADIGAQSRQQIAEAVARHLPALRGRLPRKRKAWETDSHNMALFSAMAVALTYFRLSCAALLDDLREDAAT